MLAIACSAAGVVARRALLCSAFGAGAAAVAVCTAALIRRRNVDETVEKISQLLADDSDAFESHYVDCDEDDEAAEVMDGKPKKLKRKFMPYRDGVVTGGYLTHVVALARDRFYSRGLAADTEAACRTFMSRTMREHGMRELDIQRSLPKMLLAVFYVTDEEREYQRDVAKLRSAGRLSLRRNA
jgi:hypothetical protein